MAGRTNTSIAMGVTITLLGVATLALFVSSIVFFAQAKKLENENKKLTTDIQDFVRTGERNDDQLRAMVEQARGANQSLVGYLAASLQSTMQRVTGQRRDSFAALEEKLKTIPGADNAPLMNVLIDRNAALTDTQQKLQEADAARQAALADKKAEMDRVQKIMAAHQATIDALNAEVGQYRGELSEFRGGLDNVKTELAAQVQRVTDEAKGRENQLQSRIAELQQRNLILEDQLARLRGEKRGVELRPTAEETLADGQIIGLDPSRQQVYLNLGRNRNMVLGMTFAVYGDAAQIRKDEDGNYVPGKATIEVINVGAESSTARIISETRGNPIVRNDVIANAVYDPNKTYKFVVFGNFDTNRDGNATPAEREDVRTMIEAWGGKVVDDMQGDVDFLVLGSEPVLPPRPGVDVPIEVVQAYIRQEKDVNTYRDLQKTAIATSVPVLNENRLYTLIGKTPAPARRN